MRTTLDLPFEGHTRVEQYALGDLLVAGNLPNFHIFSSDHGFMGLFPMGGEHFPPRGGVCELGRVERACCVSSVMESFFPAVIAVTRARGTSICFMI
jgi:hypothetical protein